MTQTRRRRPPPTGAQSARTPGSRLPPHSVDVEGGTLGGLLLHPDLFDGPGSRLQPEDFYRPAHRQFFEAALAVHTRKGPASPMDLTLVTEELLRLGHAE